MPERFLDIVPHSQALQISLVSASPDGVECAMPFQADLEANPGSGIIHSGAITSLIDTVSGMSALIALPEIQPCPTLDLRLDHLALPEAGLPIHAFAEAYRLTRSVVFVRGYAFNTDRSKPFVHSVGTFMRVGGSKMSGGAKHG